MSRLHLIGNAHLDPVWLWRWPEGCAEAIGTCWAAVELLSEYPGMIFTRGEAVVYSWIEDLDPALFARIQDLVRAGRWAIVNGWWLQPDCNLPAGEAFVRQALYGRRYFRERFGIEVTVGYNVDSFGHVATLPMLLRHTGFTHYVFMRPKEHEHALPSSLFDWVAPDGSAVRAFRIPITYDTSTPGPPVESKLEQVRDQARDEGIPLMCFYGVGNHGGGPTRRDLEAIARFQAAGGDAVFSDPARYFAEVAALPRPAVRSELQMHAVGCYSVVSSLKALNRRAEAALAQAESASALALLHTGAEYPHPRLRQLWQTLLFNQFHDILCGTAVPSATRDAEQALGGVIQEAEQLVTAAVRRLAASVGPAPSHAEAPFLVFNLTGAGQHAALEYEPWTGWEPTTYRLLDDQGAEVPYQLLPPENFTHRSLPRILFAPEVPAFGYRLYRLVAGPSPNAPSRLQARSDCLESDAWRLVVDADGGGIASLTDKRSGRELFSGVANQALLVDDSLDTWSHEEVGFAFEGRAAAMESCVVLEQGPVRAAIQTHARAGRSTIITTYLLYADPALPLEIRVTVDWHERDTLLRLSYPLAFQAPSYRYEVAYGSLERSADGREYPGQRWVLLSDADGYGIVVANDAKYSYAARDGMFCITAVRSPVYAHHRPVQLDPDGRYPYIDQGEQTFVVRLLAGPGVRARQAQQLADDLLCPPLATPHVAREGSGPHRAGLLGVQASSSSAVWLKAAEDGQDMVLRVLEHEGHPDTVTLPASGNRFSVPPYGLLTLRRGGDGHWRQSDGLEGDGLEAR